MFKPKNSVRFSKEKFEAGITSTIVSSLATNLKTNAASIHKKLDDAYANAGGEISMTEIFYQIFHKQYNQKNVALNPPPAKSTESMDATTSTNSDRSSLVTSPTFEDALEDAMQDAVPVNIVSTDADPLAFVTALWGETDATPTKKKTKKTDNNANLITFQHGTNGTQENPTAFDQTFILRNETKLDGHFMIPMAGIQKYFCTHCLGTIDERLVHDHKSKCFNTKTGEYSGFYCSCCNAKNTQENCDAHFNSAKHASRMAYIKELIRTNATIYVNATGVSHVHGSTTAQSGDKVDLKFLVERVRQSESLYQKYKVSGGKQLFRLMNSIIQSKEHGNDELAITLAQRNAIIKTYLNYLAEVNGQRVLCHPKIEGESEDFIRVENCADALKEINFEIISRNTKIDEATKNKQKTQINLIFGQTTDTRVARCHVCNADHEIKYYANSAALCKMIQLMINQLKKN